MGKRYKGAETRRAAGEFTVNLWGCKPGEDDCCWSGDNFSSEVEARNVYENYEDFFSSSCRRGTVFVELDGPGVHEERRVAPDPKPESDDEWRREMAMEAGMGMGVNAYNDMMFGGCETDNW